MFRTSIEHVPNLTKTSAGHKEKYVLHPRSIPKKQVESAAPM